MNDDEMAAAPARGARLLQGAHPAWVARAEALWKPGAAATASAGVGRWLQGWLCQDSGRQGSALALGARGGAGMSRQILFGSEGVDIDLRIAADPPSGHFAVRGQVLAETALARVRLHRVQESSSAECGVDPFGEFELGLIEPGRYWLSVHCQDQVIEFPCFDVPEGTPPPGHEPAVGDAA